MTALRVQAAIFSLLFALSLAVAPASAQMATPPPPTPPPKESPTALPTATLTVSTLCLVKGLGAEECRERVVREYPWLRGALLILIVLGLGAVLFWLRGIGSRLEQEGKAFPDRLAGLFRRGANPTRYYLKHFITDFEDPKYQPFTGDDVRKPKLERIYLPLDLRLEARGDDEEGKQGEGRELGGRAFARAAGDRIQLAEAIRRSKTHLALIGGAGCGKSTFLQWTGLACAKDCARVRLKDERQREIVRALSKTAFSPWAFRLIRALRLTRPLFPIFIPLGEFVQFCANPRDPQQPEKPIVGPLPYNAESLVSFACWRFNRRHPNYRHALTPSYFQRRLREGAVLLFDGVDEVVFEHREGVRGAVVGLLREDFVAPQTRALLTSRPPGYAREAWADDFLKCDVLPMTPRQRDALIRNLFHTIYSDADRAAEKTRTLIDSLNRSDERVQAMAQTPLLATIFAKLQHNAYRLPDQRARVYKEAVDLILDEVYRRDDADRFLAATATTTTDTGGTMTGDSGQRLTWLSRIAFELQLAGAGEAGMIRDDLINKVTADADPTERRVLAERLRSFLHTMARNACLIEETQENYFGFRSHRSFQEYLAGRYLVQEYAPYDLGRQEAFVRETARSRNREQWEEPLRLAVGFLAIDAETRVELFLSMLHNLSLQLDESDGAGDWCRAVAALALFDLPATRSEALGRLKRSIVDSAFEAFVRSSSPLGDPLLVELGLTLAQTRDPRLAQSLLDKLLTADPPVVRPTQRRAIGLALGAIGDPRFPTPPLSRSSATGEGPGVGAILPALVCISAGPFRMGTSDDEAELLKAQNAEALAHV